MRDESRVLPVEMQEVVSVRALESFILGDRTVAVGEIVSLPRHTADYAVFLRKAAWLS